MVSQGYIQYQNFPRPLFDDYNYFPKSWNLLKCFEYYLEQKELWTTPSIKEELTVSTIDMTKEILPENVKMLPPSKEDKKEEVVDEYKIKMNDEEEPEAEK